METDKRIVKEALAELLDERNRVDSVTHQKHHAYIEIQIEKEEKRKRRCEKIKTQVMGWGIIAILGGIGTAVYNWGWHIISIISKKTGGP